MNVDPVKYSVVLALGLVMACKADLPPLTDANNLLDAQCKGPHADLLVDTFPMTLAMPNNALGAPDTNVVSLMGGSVITVGFVGLGGVTDASGFDVRVHMMISSGGTAEVRVADSTMSFKFAAMLTPAVLDVDIAQADLTSALYVRILGVTGTMTLDSVEATHDTCLQ